MRKCGICCRPVSIGPSVRLSVRYTIILVSCPQANASGTTSTGALNTRGWENCECRLKSPFITETIGTGLWLLWNVGKKSQMADRSVSVPKTLSDLERSDANGQISQADLLNKAYLTHGTTKLGRITQVGCICGGQPGSTQGSGPQRSPI